MNDLTNIVDQAQWIVDNTPPNLSMSQVGRQLGKPTSWVRTRLRLLALSPEIIQAAREGKLTEKQVERLTTTVRTQHRHRIFEEMINGCS